MHKDGIAVAEYWTALPPKAELQDRITEIYLAAQQRVTRRQTAVAGNGGSGALSGDGSDG